MIAAELYDRYLQDLVAGRRRACLAVVQRLLIQGVPLRALFLDLLQTSLFEVGTRWAAGQLSVAQEHLATAITEEALALAMPHTLDRDDNGRSAVIACCADELHQIGGRMVADTLAMQGWDVAFLGANTPVDDLVALVASRRFDLVGLSVALRENLPRAVQAAGKVRRAVPDVPIAVGGQAVSGRVQGLETLGGVQTFGSLPAFEAWLAAGSPRAPAIAAAG
ncbi:MAG: cobalamin-dependent protein [Anaeromyxobacter sp.]